MFRIVRNGRAGGADARLESDSVLTPEDFQRIADELGIPPIRARKIGYVAVRKAAKSEVVETHSNGKETTNTRASGDYIVTNLSPQRDTAARPRRPPEHLRHRAARFPDLYEPAGERGAHGAVYRAKGVVSAIPLPGGFDIAAPWGERQKAASGYLLLYHDMVYGGSHLAFEATHAILAERHHHAL